MSRTSACWSVPASRKGHGWRILPQSQPEIRGCILFDLSYLIVTLTSPSVTVYSNLGYEAS